MLGQYLVDSWTLEVTDSLELRLRRNQSERWEDNQVLYLAEAVVGMLQEESEFVDTVQVMDVLWPCIAVDSSYAPDVLALPTFWP